MRTITSFAKRTKIVATIGPATEDEKTMTALAKAGMNVMRLNFSHGDFAEHGGRIKTLQRVSQKTGKPMAILQDLAGPRHLIGDNPPYQDGDFGQIVHSRLLTDSPV